MAYPFKKYNYKVEIDGITEASFSEVSGFDASVDVIEYRTGDEGVNWSRKMNGLTKFGNVTLKWGMTSSLSFYDWVTSISQGTSLGEDHNKNVTITLFDDDGYVIAAVVVGEDDGTTTNYAFVTSDSMNRACSMDPDQCMAE